MSINKNFISIILPTYNSKMFLNNSIDSVLAQSYKNFELIIVDDSSTDDSYSLIKKYQKKDKRIKYFKTKRNLKNVGHPRNVGIKFAKGNFISFIDADDYWYPNKLSEQLKNIKSNDCLSCTASNYIKEKGTRKSNFIINSIRIFLQIFILNRLKNGRYYWLYIYNPVIISSSIVKKSIFKKFSFSEDENIREDLFFWLDIFPYIKNNFSFNKKILCTITRTRGSLSSIYKKEFNRIIKSISSDFIKKNKFDKFHFFIIGIFLRVFKTIISFTYSKFRKFFNILIFSGFLSFFLVFYTPLFWHIGNQIIAIDKLKYNEAIVLISGHDKVEYYNDSYQVRYLDAIKILNEYKFTPKIFLVGRNQVLPEQKILKSLLVDYGVKKESIYEIYSTSNNTKDNLINISKKLKKENIDEITIITSPYHTLRTKLLWNKNIQNIKANLFQIKPKKNNFFQRAHNIRVIIYEYIALAYNKFRGWI